MAGATHSIGFVTYFLVIIITGIIIAVLVTVVTAKSDTEILAIFSEEEKCDPNPCHNNATCIDDRIRVKCICPRSEPDTVIIGLTCERSKISHRISLLC